MLENESPKQPILRLPNRRRYSGNERDADEASKLALRFFGLPLLIVLAVMPFWDKVGDWPWVIAIHKILAPVIEQLPHTAQQGLNHRRFLIGGWAVISSIFVGQIFILLFLKKHRFLLIEQYQLKKKHFYISLMGYWILFASAWYVTFMDTDFAIWLGNNSGKALGRFYGYLIAGFPIVTLLLSQMTFVAILGASRDVAHFIRRSD